MLAAVDAERRRIERDLHDGVQQRLVALGMLLGRARRGRTPERAEALLLQAHQESQEVLAELRKVDWRVYPTALDSLGLREALGGVAERCALPLRMDLDLPGTPPAPVETAAYFVVSEAVTNAAKHSSATAVSVRVRHRADVLVVRVRDDGVGGADPVGDGLTGLAGRVGTLDGRLHAHTPSGAHHRHRGAAVRVMPAEDSTLLREGLVRLLVEEGHEVLAAVGDTDALLREVEATPPDVVVDIRMPRTTRTRGCAPRSGSASAAPASACWCCPSTSSATTPPSCCRPARSGSAICSRTGWRRWRSSSTRWSGSTRAGRVIDAEVVRRLVVRTTHGDPLARLTPRERDVLEELVQGRTNAAVSQKLHISTSAVEKNLNAVFDKLELARTTGYNRRILAVLRYLES